MGTSARPTERHPVPTFTASARSTSPSRVDVDVRQFTFVVDEPPSLGGTDLGPNPVELLLASLLGCLNVVVHLVAQERAVHVRSLHLTAEGDLDPALLFGYDIGTRAGFSGIRVHAAIDVDGSEAQARDILAEAQRRCPVGDNLLHRTPLTVAVATPALLARAAA